MVNALGKMADCFLLCFYDRISSTGLKQDFCLFRRIWD